MNSMAVVVDLELIELSSQIYGVPEERAVKILTPDGPNQAFDEGMGLWGIGDRLDPFDLHDTEIVQPTVKSE